MNNRLQFHSSHPETGDLKSDIRDLGKCEWLVGTAGWHYKDWEFIFYPVDKGKKIDKLQFYSQFFDCVEIDSTFYNLYPPEKVKDWVKRVEHNKSFMFSAKINNIFTHRMNFTRKDVKMMCQFLDKFTSSGRLEAALLQFPYHFINSKENRIYLYSLSKIFQRYKTVVELRHLSWHTPMTYNFLEESKLHLCAVDQPLVQDNINFTISVLGKYAYVRLHGRNRNAWLANSEDGKYDYLYSKVELEDILKRIEELRKRSDKVYIILNNHPIGKAAVNAFSLINLMRGGRKVLIPEQTVYCYPHLRPIAARVDTYQLPIFA